MTLTSKESLEWIMSRRSVYPKMFESSEVDKEEISSLLSAAQWAPNHKLTQPWRFKVYMGDAKMRLAELQGKALEQKMGASDQVAFKQAKMRHNAEQSAATIAIIMRRDVEKRIPEFEEIAAVSCAVQNMWLHAASLDLGAYWSTGAATNFPEMRSELNLGDDDLHLGWFYVGRFRGEIPAPANRKDITEFSEFVME